MCAASSNLRILMVSTEYPPMKGVVGRYTYNLVNSLKSNDIEVQTVSSASGCGDYIGLSSSVDYNSQVLLGLLEITQPDLVHVQYKHGLYGMDSNPLKLFQPNTGLDEFYKKAKIPIITTFHTLKGINQDLIKFVRRKTAASNYNDIEQAYNFWNQIIQNYLYHRINTFLMSKSSYGIVFSNHMQKLILGTHKIYSGSKPYESQYLSQLEARQKMMLPCTGKIALALDWKEYLNKSESKKRLKIPNNWKLIINFPKKHNNSLVSKENIINLNKPFLTESDISLLMRASDVILLSENNSHSLGLMYEGLGYGKPFITSEYEPFEEFINMNLGLAIRNDNDTIESSLKLLEKKYEKLDRGILRFMNIIEWNNIAKQHICIYNKIIQKAKNIRNQITFLSTCNSPFLE